MKKQEQDFLVNLSLSIISDKDGDYYINPSSGNIKRLIREGLRDYLNTGDLRINKLKVIPSQSL